MKELDNHEKISLFVFPKKHYDVLCDPFIYIKEVYMADSLEGKRTKINFLVGDNIIVKLRGTKPNDDELYTDGYSSATLIMDFLRERYLSNFTKYSTHLT